MTTEPRPRLSPETSNIPADAFGPSPSQTVGPYFHQGLVDFQGLTGLLRDGMLELGSSVPGERITLTGRVLDGDGQPVEDAVIEIWQADASGQYTGNADAAFVGYGRTHTHTANRRYALRTVKPGSAGPGLAPRLNVWLGMRGLLTHLITVVYFSDEDNSTDPVLALVPEERRHTLIAQREETPDGTVYRFDFRMQGKDETVFFAP
ncbi:protocatechuate 3,4-dioxygenase, alpha subunit (plasmid) [Deinococcus geothermalis DSM 11300]|uniref:Protocatechuate 3,4-dioxygenase, alpha subunit n=1 Tax=Deinococcus geothermalis (strain DSM 11300 / CIP 105573 / AG-3a) TaxID=319795 RepID=Q1J3Z7_DEIGD|nr:MULTISPECIES: protocatechuate 3,4-dioxygenase subunit alpha [Deinococcus]ABF43821.1 protocatechuate 3,4-dioxygenase, alpha subunit [Deinococcus geothermalis DSM 11300]MBI0446523.1 protocatechuate 3,4-dioxygenase subunit alpha [Deinococcus sp. DB0503]TDE85255.1 protocatechuate 3,4-dioxygenase subunit alpha [Deinococcus sp. S9]